MQPSDKKNRGGLPMPRRQCIVKMLDQPRRHRSLMLPDNARDDGSPTFEQTGDPLLLVGRDSGRRRQGDRAVFFDLRSFQ